MFRYWQWLPNEQAQIQARSVQFADSAEASVKRCAERWRNRQRMKGVTLERFTEQCRQLQPHQLNWLADAMRAYPSKTGLNFKKLYAAIVAGEFPPLP